MSYEETPRSDFDELPLEIETSEHPASPEQKYPYARTAEELAQYEEIYHPDSPLTQALQARVANLVEEGETVPYVVAVKDPSLNAFASADILTVHDGIFNKVETEEELDAILLHEIKHVTRGHTCQRNSNTSNGLEQAGSARVHEVEADVDALMTMDKKGKNPMGMFKMFDRLMAEDKRIQNEIKARESSGSRFKYHSVPHGATNERKTTLEQILTIVDTKHLSDDLTELNLPERGQMLTVQNMTPETPPVLRQALIRRTLYRMPATENHVKMQEDILAEIDPNQDPSVRRRQAELLTRYAATPEHDLNEEAIEQLGADLQILADPMLQNIVAPHRISAAKGSRIRAEIRSYLKSGSTKFCKPLAELYMEHIPSGAYLVDNDGFDVPIKHNMAMIALLDCVKENPQGNFSQEGALCNALLVNTRFSFSEYVAHITATVNDKKLGVDKKSLESATLEAMDRELDGIIAAEKDPYSLLRKISDLTVAGYADLGANSRSIRPAKVAAVQKRLCDAGIMTLAKQLLTDPSADPVTVRRCASILFRTANEYAPGLDGEKPKSSADKYTLIFTDILSGNFLSDSFEPEESEKVLAPDAQAREQLSRIAAIEEAIGEINELRPDTTDLTIEQVISRRKIMRQALLYDALTDIYKGEEIGKEKLVKIFQEYELPRLNLGSFYTTQAQLEKIASIHDAQLAAVMETPGWQEDDDSLLLFAALGATSTNVELNLTAIPFVFKQMARKRSLEECEELLDSFSHLKSAHGPILEIMMEEKAQMPEDFEQLNVLIKRFYTASVERNLQSIGTATLLDSIVIPNLLGKSYQREVGLKTDVIGGLQSSDVMAALLSTGHDEHPLKLLGARQWWIRMRTETASSISEQFVVEDYIFKRGPAKRAILQHWLAHDYPANGQYEPFESDMDKFYLLTNEGRFLAVRKLLLEENGGVLYSKEKITDLVDALMGSWLHVEDEAESEVLRDLLLDLITHNESSTTYMHIGPMLQDMILKPPKERSGMEPVYDDVAKLIISKLEEKGRLRNPTEEDRHAIRTRVERLFLGSAHDKKQDKSKAIDVPRQALEAIGVIDAQTTGRMSTIAFAALVGKKAGALGVKQLQLAKQYFELTPEDEKEFEGIYDDMTGQSRLQAYNVLKREAETDATCAEIFDSIVHFGPRIGGGSLFTVYRVELKDGRTMALGVKNPNAEYRVSRLAGFASTGLDATAQKYPKNTTIQLMDTLLSDATQWVYDELVDENYSHKDTVFRQQNDTRTESGFQKGGSRYDLMAPTPEYAGSSWVRCEEFVDGNNLSNLTITDGPSDIKAGLINHEDLKDATSLLVRNTVFQIAKGDFAHSDTHPGNYRITADNSQVAIFDRHNLIPVTPEIRHTLKTVVQSLASGDAANAGMAIATHAAGTDADTGVLAASVQNALSKSAEPGQVITNMLLELKRNGVRVPLNLSLILRNFMSVAQFSEQAGFDNLAEAFMHTSTDPEEINWIFS